MTGLMLPPTDVPDPGHEPEDGSRRRGLFERPPRPEKPGRSERRGTAAPEDLSPAVVDPGPRERRGRRGTGKRGKRGAEEQAGSSGKRRARGANRDLPAGAASVNLLSPWVVEENKVRLLRRRFVVMAVGLVAIIALVWVGLHLEIRNSESSLREDEAAAARLQTKITQMGPVRSYDAAITQRATLVADKMAPDVTFSRALEALAASLPEGVEIQSLTGTMIPADDGTTPPDASAASCPGPDPFQTNTIAGCLELSGLAPSREAVSQLVQVLDESSLFVEPFVSTTTTDDADVVTFSGSIGLDERLLSGRYPTPVTDQPTAAADAEQAAKDERKAKREKKRARKAAKAASRRTAETAGTDTEVTP